MTQQNPVAHLSLDLVVEELLLEVMQREVGAVVVEVEWVEHVLHHGRLARVEDVIGEHPRHRHLDRELNKKISFAKTVRTVFCCYV